MPGLQINTDCHALRLRRLRLGLLLAVLLLVLVVRLACPYRLVRVDGNSMMPTFHNGQLLIVDVREPRRTGLVRGEIVFFRWQGRSYVKRVHALAGETVWKLASALGADTVLSDTQRPWVLRQSRRSPSVGRVVAVPVPAGEVFLLGDALTNSVDSRDFGPVPLDCVEGRVISAVTSFRPLRLEPAAPLLATASLSPR